jgi:hypothetical protein
LAVREDDRSQVKTGELTCAAKLHTFQVSRFVPRFVDAGTGRGVWHHARDGRPCGWRHGDRPMLRSASAFRLWVCASLIGALVVTVVDALLLERSKGFFRGGFLATDYLEGPSQTVLFVLLSVVIDAAGFGLIVAVVAGLLRLLKLHPLARVLGGSLAAFGLLLGYDVISYQILRYLGDAFDLGLMLDLVDGNVSEILAVSSSQLVMPAVMAVSAFALIALAVWRTHRSAGPVPGPSAEPLT